MGASSSLLMATITFLHAGEVLDRPRNPDCDVKVRGHHLAGLADLPVVWGIAGVHRRPRCADGGAELVGGRLPNFFGVLCRAQRTPARDDDAGRGQLRPVALGELLALEGRAV